MKIPHFPILLTALVSVASAQSTIDPAFHYFWSANAGWLNGLPSLSNGLRTADTVCSGYVWSTNVGWINFGDGTPTDGIRYSGTGGDFGVNVLADGSLRGHAWGANIGWVSFESTGNPRIDLATGNLLGHAWSANIGWLNLSAYAARTSTIAITDSDNDGISDAWEREHASGSLTTLGTPGDADGDGQSDLAEFEADTTPLDPADSLKVVSFNRAASVNLVFTSRPTRIYQVMTSTSLSSESWVNVGIGDLTGEAGTTLASFPTDAAPKRFFRVEARRPLASP